MSVMSLYSRDRYSDLTDEQWDFVRRVYEECEKHYSDGGDVVVECYTPHEIVRVGKLARLCSLLCGLKVEQALNCREGTDEDPELERMRRFEQNWQ